MEGLLFYSRWDITNVLHCKALCLVSHASHAYDIILVPSRSLYLDGAARTATARDTRCAGKAFQKQQFSERQQQMESV